MIPFAAVFIFLASGVSAYLLHTRFRLPQQRPVRALTCLVLWELVQLAPVHALATLQIAGLIGRVTITKLAVLQSLILAGAFAWVYSHPLPRVLQRKRGWFEWRGYLMAVTTILVCSYTVFALNLLTSVPGGSDANAYHLPLALRWLQTGSLAIPISKAWRFTMPGNAEIGMMLLLATGSGVSTVLVSWLALAVLTLSTYMLTLRVSRGDRLVSTTVALVVLSIPMVEFQAFSGYVDLLGTAFVLAGFGLLCYRDQDDEAHRAEDLRSTRLPGLLFLSAAACGISLGTKPIYDLYAAAYVIFAFAFLLRDTRGQRAALARATTLVLAGLLLPSIFWFGRGTQATHNPVFPMQVSVCTHVILPGYTRSEITPVNFDQNFVRDRLEWFIYPWTEWQRNPGYTMIPYGTGSGLGAAFASLVPIGIVFLFYRTCMERAESQTNIILLAVLSLGALAWWFVLFRVPRFGLPIVVLGCISAAPYMAAFQSYRQRAWRILLVGTITLTCAISSFVPLHLLLGRLRTHSWSRAECYSYPSLLDRLPPGSCVLNETNTDEMNFALAGKGLERCVVPAFELRAPVTPEFLRDNHVDFIAQIVPAEGEGFDPGSLAGISLIREEMMPRGEEKVRWRVWKVDHP